MKRYRIEVDQSQAQVLCNALDLYSRIAMQQFRAIGDVISDFEDRKISRKDRDQLQAICGVLSVMFGQLPNSSRGIFDHEIHPSARTAYDLQQAVMCCRAVAEEHAEHSVWRREPLQSNSKQPLALCEVIE